MLVIWIIYINNCTVVTLNSTTKILKSVRYLTTEKIPTQLFCKMLEKGTQITLKSSKNIKTTKTHDFI